MIHIHRVATLLLPLLLSGCVFSEMFQSEAACPQLQMESLVMEPSFACVGDPVMISLKRTDDAARVKYVLSAKEGSLVSVAGQPGTWQYTGSAQPGSIEFRAYLIAECGQRMERFQMQVVQCGEDTPTDGDSDSSVKVPPDPPIISYSGPRHVILLIGDGMEPHCETGLSRYMTGTDASLSFHGFPYSNHVTTWDIDTYNAYARVMGGDPYDEEHVTPTFGYDPALGGSVVTRGDDDVDAYILRYQPDPENFSPVYASTDSASSATALATGFKTDRSNLSWRFEDPEDGAIATIAEQARSLGMKMGVVTTVPFSHATPAAFVSHNASRSHYIEIAEEIISTTVPDVVIGAGHPLISDSYSYIDETQYNELKNSDTWVLAERQEGVDGGDSLMAGAAAAVAAGKPLFGLYGAEVFSESKPVDNPGTPQFTEPDFEDPTLTDAVLAATMVLSNEDRGFFLMVEGGAIDKANHNHDYERMIGNMRDFDMAVKAAVDWVNEEGDDVTMENTLILVTADHSNGYISFDEENPMGIGQLPDGENDVTWSGSTHTNQMVHIYATGAGIAGSPNALFAPYEHVQYPAYPIIDNTHIYQAMAHFLGIDTP